MSALDKYVYGDIMGSDSDLSYHPDFTIVSTSGTYGMRVENEVIFEGLQAREEIETLSLETRLLLSEICNSVSEIVDDIAGDFGDFAADLDEMI
jgi:hypothetical protein